MVSFQKTRRLQVYAPKGSSRLVAGRYSKLLYRVMHMRDMPKAQYEVAARALPAYVRL
jgi:hypothetical protein